MDGECAGNPFKLRSGVRFHDGTPLTADDVVFTFGPERFSGEKAPGRAVAWEFLGNRLELTRFDGYWGKTAPAAKVSFVEVPELSARVAGLRSGEFDLITEVPPNQVKPLSADGRIDVTGGAIDNIYGLVFDCKSSAVMQSKELRQAILHAIDRDILVNALFAGRTSTADSFQSKTFGELYLATAGENSTIPPRPGLSSRPRATGASPSSGASRRATTRRSSSSRRPSPPCSRPQAST